MGKSALGIIFSLVLVTAAGPSVAASTKAVESAKKTVVKKQKQVTRVVTKASHKKVKLKATKSAKKSWASKASVVVRKSPYQRVAFSPSSAGPASMTAGDQAGLHLTRDPLDLNSNAVLVMDQSSSEVLFEKIPR